MPGFDFSKNGMKADGNTGPHTNSVTGENKNPHTPLQIRNGTATLFIFRDRFRVQQDTGKLQTFLFGGKMRRRIRKLLHSPRKYREALE